ncbi:YceI family protein [Variovorax sp. YR216]|uniref:YceI family protein n=1 Tax=Variovorax sp. YR216 TaxID=1882828 RepID=UPI0015A12ADA|nr:YceI family protein [Variovorax sp. YR216]
MRKPAATAALLAGLAFHVGVACAADWKLEPAGSRLEFAATFEKTPAPGVFREFDVKLGLDPAKEDAGRLDVTINIASADMASADINKVIAGAEWFDFARFRQAEFHATEIRRVQPNAFVARGTLMLKGVQQAVEVPFSWSESGSTATMEGKFVVKRSAFGIGTGEWTETDTIGADVTVTFKVRLRKAA